MEKHLPHNSDSFKPAKTIVPYTILGCHRAEQDGQSGFLFRVWAPNAKSVSVRG